MAYPRMISGAARDAGIEVPEDPEDYDKDKYPRWYIFCIMQLGASMPYPGVHFDNAKIIAEIKDDELETVTAQQLFDRGFYTGATIP